MRVGISKVAIQTLTSIGNSFGGTPTPNSGSAPDNIFGDLNNQVSTMGGTATPYENDNFMGVEITLPFNSLDEMQNQINTIFGNSSGGSSASNPFVR